MNTPEAFGKVLRSRGAAAGLDCIGFHDLRHYFCSVCVMAGIDFMTIAAWLGHKDGGILVGKVYGHLLDEHRQKSAKRLSFDFKKTGGAATERCQKGVQGTMLIAPAPTDTRTFCPGTKPTTLSQRPLSRSAGTHSCRRWLPVPHSRRTSDTVRIRIVCDPPEAARTRPFLLLACFLCPFGRSALPRCGE